MGADTPETPRARPIDAPTARLIALADIQELENARSQLGDVSALAESIRVRGLLHPVLVRPAADTRHGKPYELIAGYRRLAGFRELGHEQIPAMVREAGDEELLAELISENLHRENHSPIDEARTMQRMIELLGWSHRQVAQQLGIDRTRVVHRLRLLQLAPKVQQLIGEGKLTATHAEVVARLDEHKDQEELAELAVRLDAPVSKLKSFAAKIVAEQAEQASAEVEPADEHTPLDEVTAEHVVALPHVTVAAELDPLLAARALVFALLRAGNDVEMVEYLRERCDADWEDHWEWVSLLDEEQCQTMTDTLLRRWLSAGHRHPTLPPRLRDELAAGLIQDRPEPPDDLPTIASGATALPPDADQWIWDEDEEDDDLDWDDYPDDGEEE